MKPLLKLWHSVIDALVPPRKSERLVRLVTLEDFAHLRKGRTVGAIEALLPYEDPKVQALIWELKYYGSAPAAALLGTLLSEELRGLVPESLSHKPLLIPVPLHTSRQKSRGYNQVERVTTIAASLCEGMVEHAPHFLIRTRDTPRQTALPRKTRVHNVARAFTVLEAPQIQGRTCILVDDVATTGSTLGAAANALTDAGATKVILLALTHAG